MAKGRGSASSVSAVMLLAFGILSFRVAAWVIYRSELAYITNDGYVIARIFQMLVVVLLMVSMRNRIPSKRVFIGGMVLATVATVVASAVVIFGSNGVLPPFLGNGSLRAPRGCECVFLSWMGSVCVHRAAF